ncbi:8194_t:CDS:2 [Acaulospora morrowiae]|uniref:8194_t:CDS:1 n=1 Tax=Acaulospora morrowiae TaxID=94023 RepID=A0A9N9A0L1_9GLOM|nr:8194_t:CDS:2 [Acaulospora morrowiae]
MSSELKLLKQRIIVLEAENTAVKLDVKREVENTELKAEVLKLRYDFEELKRQTLVITSAQDMPSFAEQSHLRGTEDISHSPTNSPFPRKVIMDSPDGTEFGLIHALLPHPYS